MTKNRPLPNSVPEFIAHALAFEHEAASRFHEYANYMQDKGHADLAGVFRRLEAVERAHMDALRECAGGNALPELQPCDYLRQLIATRNALALAFPRAPRDVREALVLALAAERRAELYYRDAAANAPSAHVRGLAADLAAGEYRHVRLVERLLAHAAAA